MNKLQSLHSEANLTSMVPGLQVFDPNGKPTWLGIEIPLDIGAITGIEFVLIAAAEIFRNGESDPEKKKYPGQFAKHALWLSGCVGISAGPPGSMHGSRVRQGLS